MPGGMSLHEKTIAQLLPSSYTSMAIGKWHLGIGAKPGGTEFMPTQRGFDSYFGVPHGLGACPCFGCFPQADGGRRACAIGCQPAWAPCPLYNGTEIVQQPANLLTLSDQYGSAAADFVKSSAAAGFPFFLFYASHHVHSPQYAGKVCTNSSRRGRVGDSLAQLDAEVGRVLDVVRSAGASANTLTIFSSDNGPSLRNRGRGGNAGLLRCGKGTTYEHGSPLLVP